ncbi:MAG TPA: hypothetical protein VGJ39_11410, partial [Vicinamibacterales bacterium]
MSPLLLRRALRSLGTLALVGTIRPASVMVAADIVSRTVRPLAMRAPMIRPIGLGPLGRGLFGPRRLGLRLR